MDRLFRDVYRVPLAPETVEQVTSRTGGWAAGLQLLHLASDRPGGDVASRAARPDMADRSRLLRAYLATNVLAELPPALRAFVHRCAPLGLLVPALCDRLLDATGSRDMLEELERRQICRPVPGGHRLPPLLQAYLDSALRERLGPATEGEYARAARLLEDAGAYVDALRAYARAGDWKKTTRLLERHGEQVAAHRSATGWDDVLPAELLEGDPWLLLAAARYRYADGQLHRALDLYDRAERAASDPRAQGLARQEREEVSAWSADALVSGPAWYACLRAATRSRPLAQGRRALAEADPDPGRILAAGLSALLAGHPLEAEARLTSLPTSPGTAAGPPPAVPAALAARLGILVARSLLGERPAHQAVEAIALEAEVHDLPWLARQARAVLALSGQPDDQGEAAAASRECELDGDDWGALLAGLVDAGRRLAAGLDVEEAAERAALLARRLRAGVLECWARALLALAQVNSRGVDAEPAARGAEAVARNAEVPGARAVALVALACCLPPGERRDETAELGQALLAECGLLPDVPLAALRPPPHLSVSVAARTSRPLPVAAPAADLHCFGGFALRVADRELDWPSVRPRARATLRLLALHAGQPVHRETLIAQLWPDQPADTARHSLQVAVSTLRRHLEPAATRGASAWLIRDGDTYALVLPPGSRHDVREFKRARRRWREQRGTHDPDAEAATLRRALVAYAGELLPEDGPAEWVVGERERLRLEAAESATALGELELARDRPAAAVEALERAVHIDPLRDGAWRALWLAHRAVGDIAAASRARREYLRVLAELEAPISVW